MVWHDTDFAVVLVAAWCLDDDERRAQLRADAAALHMAFLTNYAVNDPKRLERAQRTHIASLAMGVAPRVEIAQSLADARAQLQQAGRLPVS